MRLSDLNNVPVAVAAKLMGVGQQFIRMGMQREKLPLGNAIKVSGCKYTYYISPYKLSEYTGLPIDIEIPEDLVCVGFISGHKDVPDR